MITGIASWAADRDAKLVLYSPRYILCCQSLLPVLQIPMLNRAKCQPGSAGPLSSGIFCNRENHGRRLAWPLSGPRAQPEIFPLHIAPTRWCPYRSAARDEKSPPCWKAPSFSLYTVHSPSLICFPGLSPLSYFPRCLATMPRRSVFLGIELTILPNIWSVVSRISGQAEPSGSLGNLAL